MSVAKNAACWSVDVSLRRDVNRKPVIQTNAQTARAMAISAPGSAHARYVRQRNRWRSELDISRGLTSPFTRPRGGAQRRSRGSGATAC